MVLVGSNGPCWSLLVVVNEQVGTYVIMILQHYNIFGAMVLAGRGWTLLVEEYRSTKAKKIEFPHWALLDHIG